MNSYQHRAIDLLSRELGYTPDILEDFLDKAAKNLSELKYQHFEVVTAIQECALRLAAEDKIAALEAQIVRLEEQNSKNLKYAQADIKQLKKDRYLLMRVNTMAGRIIIDQVESLREEVETLQARIKELESK